MANPFEAQARLKAVVFVLATAFAVSSLGFSSVTNEDRGILRAESPADYRDRLQRAAGNLAQQVELIAPNTLPLEVIQELDRAIERMFSDRADSEIREAQSVMSKTAQSNLGRRLRGLLAHLHFRGKIRYFNSADAQAREGLHRDTLAVYLPLSGQILLDSSLPHDQALKALYHELVHAYQYTYRLPLDLSLIDEAKKKRGWSDDQADDILSYYYESQGGYYALRNWVEEDWSEFLVKSSGGRIRAIGPTVGGALYLVYLGSPLALAAVAAYKLWEEWRANSLVPLIDNEQKSDMSEVQGALGLSELVPIPDARNNLLFSRWNFRFHERYARSTARAYFDQDTEVHFFSADRTTLKFFNRMHNSYYERIGDSEVVDQDPNCVELLKRVSDSPISPLYEWLVTEQAEANGCGAYSNLDVSRLIREWSERVYLPMSESASPFVWNLRAGGVGSLPDLKVLRAVRLQPQLRVRVVDSAKEGE